MEIEMRLNGILLLGALLLVPQVGLSIPTHKLNIGSGSGANFSGSVLHTADRCESNGYYMCGTQNHRDLQGQLSMTWDPVNNAYKNISGSLFSADGTYVNVYGGNLYTQLNSQGWGSLNTNYGIFTFDDLSGFYNGAANNYTNETYYLWGQTRSII